MGKIKLNSNKKKNNKMKQIINKLNKENKMNKVKKIIQNKYSHKMIPL